MLDYLCSFIDQSNKIEQELIYYYAKYKKKLGLTDEVVEKMMNQIIETKNNRDNQF